MKKIILILSLLAAIGGIYSGIQYIEVASAEKLQEVNVQHAGEQRTFILPAALVVDEKDNILPGNDSESCDAISLPDISNESIPEVPDPALKLVGTVTGKEKGRYAVIEDMVNGKQHLCRVGDEIKKAILEKIFTNKVLLSINGQNIILSIERSGNLKILSGGSLQADSVLMRKYDKFYEMQQLINITVKQGNLPAYLWTPPGLDTEDFQSYYINLKYLSLYGEKVRNETASEEERENYYEIKIALLEDKLELIRSDLDAIESGSDYIEKYVELKRKIAKTNNTIKLLEKEIDMTRKEIEKNTV